MMLSVASDRPVAPMTLEILTLVERVTRELALDYFVVGATARDILLYGVFGFDTGRATRDVDIAVALDGWPQFDLVKARLVETGACAPDGSTPHRFIPSTCFPLAASNSVRPRSPGPQTSPSS